MTALSIFIGLPSQAIKWASKNNVDIINISAGFVNYHDEVFNAIAGASRLNPDLLVFAAAANYANLHDGVAFPAKHRDHVFCIFSCSGNLKQTNKTNPDPLENSINFAVLGENVTMPSGEKLNGSSISTALVSGFAALILDFTQHQDTMDYLSVKCRHSKQLPTRRGIRAVLKHASTADGRYKCIAPWKLLKVPGAIPHSTPERLHIHKTIKFVLNEGLD